MTYQGHHKRFINDLYGKCNEVTAGHFSVQFIRKACIAAKTTRKVLAFRNMRINPDAQLGFLRAVEHVSPDQLVSIDGLVQSHSDFNPRRGYSVRGQRAVERQIVIRDISFAVMIACRNAGKDIQKKVNCLTLLLNFAKEEFAKESFSYVKKLTSALVFFFKMLAAIPYADASGRYPNFPTEKLGIILMLIVCNQ